MFIVKKTDFVSKSRSSPLYNVVCNIDNKRYIGNEELEELLPKEDDQNVVEFPEDIKDVIMSDIEFGRLIRAFSKYENIEMLDIDCIFIL